MKTIFIEPTKLEHSLTNVKVFYNANDVQGEKEAKEFFYSESKKKINRMIQNSIHPCGW